MQSLRQISGTAALCAVLVSAAGCSAQTPRVAAVRTALPSAAAALHGKALHLLPAGAQDAQFDDKQAVTVDGTPQLTVLPVRFKTPVPDAAVEGQVQTQCGVVVTPQGGAPSLLVTLGTGNTEMMTCAGIKAVGGTPAAKPGERPDLILIYDAYTGRESVPATILLTWHAQQNTYAVDDTLSQWLGEQKNGRTVVGARRLLATKRHN